MKFTRMLCLWLASVVALSVIGVSSAMAESTQLCEAHEYPCAAENVIASDTLHLATSIALLEARGGNETSLLCLAVLSNVDYGSLGTPQSVTVLSLSFSTCGTEGSGGSHSNCGTVQALYLPYSATLLKIALNLGELEISYGLNEAKKEVEPTTLVKCTVFGFIKVECEFGGAELVFHVDGAAAKSNGLLLAEGVLPKIAGGSLCPEESEITTGILEPLKPSYVLGSKGAEGESKGGSTTQLCKAHEYPCAAENVITSDTLHLATSIALLEARGGNETSLLCLAVLSNVDYGSLGTPQSVTVLSLSFSTCGTEGSGGSHSNCGTVQALYLPYSATLLKTGLNLGELEISYGLNEAKKEVEPTTLVKCTVFGFIKVECEFGGSELVFHVDGAAAKSNGLLLAEGVLPKIAGGSLCPEESEITTGILEPLKPSYIVG